MSLPATSLLVGIYPELLAGTAADKSIGLGWSVLLIRHNPLCERHPIVTSGWIWCNEEEKHLSLLDRPPAWSEEWSTKVQGAIIDAFVRSEVWVRRSVASGEIQCLICAHESPSMLQQWHLAAGGNGWGKCPECLLDSRRPSHLASLFMGQFFGRSEELVSLADVEDEIRYELDREAFNRGRA